MITLHNRLGNTFRDGLHWLFVVFSNDEPATPRFTINETQIQAATWTDKHSRRYMLPGTTNATLDIGNRVAMIILGAVISAW